MDIDLTLQLPESAPESALGEPYDVIIVGAGPAGAAAAIYAARAGLRTLVLDKGLRSGALGLAGKIANYPGLSRALTGAELLQHMRQQAKNFGATILQDKVLSTDLAGEIKQVRTGSQVYSGRAVIIASGAMGRTYVIAGESGLVGRGVSYCATCDGPFFRDRVVAVAGNNDEAAEEALQLTRFARHVHLLVPARELRAARDLVEKVNAEGRVEVHRNTILREVIGSQHVEAVRIQSDGGEETDLPVAGVFIYLQGRSPITDFLGGGLPTDEAGCLVVDEAMQTNVAGVFAAGDVLCKHLKQAIIAAGEGAQAAMSAQRFLSGQNQLRPDWS